MKLIKLLLTYLVIVFFFGCASKKTTTKETYVKQTDSVNKTLQLKTENKLVITSLCDSVTGKAKEYSSSSNNGLNSVKTSIKDNTLTIETKSDSIVYKDRFKDKIVYMDNNIETVKYKTPFWHWILHIVLVLLILFTLRIIRI